MRVLFIKLTSMGDLIHALPALTDLHRHRPDVSIDWVIDESFHEVATWHPIVDSVIQSAHRRWRRTFLESLFSGRIHSFLAAIRQTDYDLILDGQHNLKSAMVTYLARGAGKKHGVDKASVREAGAQLAYDVQHHVPKGVHAIFRQRQLFAKTFDYPLPETLPDFGLDKNRFIKPAVELPEPYLCFIHNASWESKLWPELYWVQLIELASQAKWSILLPSGNDKEAARALRLAAEYDNVIALPRLRLSEVAYILSQAKGAVSVDTGLSHLTGALNIPAVTLYGSTDSGLIGAPGAKQYHFQSGFACAPCYQQHCTYRGTSRVRPACYETLTPSKVWAQLQLQMAS